MRPLFIGRTLGIGVRVAARVAGQHMTAQSTASTARTATVSPARHHATGKAAGQTTRGVARGVGGFLRPFGRVGHMIWLEVAGVFFFLPVLVFGPTLWRIRMSYAHGPDHSKFLLCAGIIVVFFYLSVSSFWRAHRK